MGRYRLICVAPEMGDLMTTDSINEAIANSSQHYEVYDSVEDTWVPTGPEDYYLAQVACGRAPRYGYRELFKWYRHTNCPLWFCLWEPFTLVYLRGWPRSRQF